MTIHLGCASPHTSRDLPGRRVRNAPWGSSAAPAVPIRSCSRWGLPCRRRCRQRGALLPHPFTLTSALAGRGGLLSVALSLGSPPPGVTRHRVSLEPGLSSPARLSPLGKSGHPADWRSPPIPQDEEHPASFQREPPAGSASLSRRNVSIVETSATPSTRSGRKCR